MIEVVIDTLNIFNNYGSIIPLCEENDLASINRSPLAMGLLSGKFNEASVLPKEDVRGAGHAWADHLFKDGKPNKELLRALDAIRSILTSNGRTVAQGALAWIWARSKVTIPIPGFKAMKQMEENVKAMDFSPLSETQIREIDNILNGIIQQE